jgi:hypothetical protein
MENNLSRWGVVKLFSALFFGMALAFSLAISPAAMRASTMHQPQPGPSVITIPAGGTATLTARGFCLDYGKPFPTGDTTTRALTVDRIRAALNYSIQKGYTEGNAPQVQLAVWYLRDNTWRAEQRTIAEEIVRESATTALPPASTDAISLADAVSQNRVSVTARFVPQTVDAFYGDGQVQVRNLGTSEIRIYLAIGSIFTTGNATFQDLAAYQLSLQQGTTTPVTTSTPATTQQPTSQPTITAVTTPPTGTITTTTTTTPAATGTAGGTVTAGATTTADATTTAGTATATTAATGTVVETGTVETTATSTVATTVEATATTVVEATPTEAIETPTAEATATTETTGGGTLPETGSEDMSLLPLLVLIFGISLALVGWAQPSGASATLLRAL